MSTKTTTKDFRLFRKACVYWVKRFGLTEWEITFEHKDLEYEGATASASCAWYMEGRQAEFSLSKDYGEEVTDTKLVEVAFHEVMELILASIRNRSNDSKYTEEQKSYFQRECAHEIMHRIYYAFRQGIDKDNKKIIKEFNGEGSKPRTSKVSKGKEDSTKD